MTKSSDINQIPYSRQEFPKTLKNDGDMSGFLESFDRFVSSAAFFGDGRSDVG
jgi:hypothetical protein